MEATKKMDRLANPALKVPFKSLLYITPFLFLSGIFTGMAILLLQR